MTSTTAFARRAIAATSLTAAAVLSPFAADAVAATAPGHAGTPAPSSCRPANYQANIKTDHPSAGQRHYRVTLTAAPGYAPCTLQGSPQDLIFSQGAGPAGVSATTYGDQRTPVTFGPGNPVHFDISTPDTPGGAPVDGVSFTLGAPGGVIPGTGAAQGGMEVDKGTQVGPIEAGA
ncbi:DUF4232 domain-containing protein [Sciscionella sediminilitoris]|uniref:DUF4232 domain-containing protein n=1 Tax=Sciscionella sediminilitoris TaxID=1445613 RepID=UPI0004DF51AF|nr:DUF4232 domain-containing protein [Sciscionella sp. SE31]